MNYYTTEIGQPHSMNYRIYFQDRNGFVSPLHDIPLFPNQSKTVCNMVVEAQRFTNAKMEISLWEPLNPIRQVTQRGALSFIPNCFPYHGFLWNYGALPQTYEFPGIALNSTRCTGRDPIDVVEIGQRRAQTGEILCVKILGALALVDLDELRYDWQLIAIDTRDPLSDLLIDVSDIERYLPGLIQATVDWFKIYKVPYGKPENMVGPGGGIKSASFALDMIEEVHNNWKHLISRKIQNNNVTLENTTLEGNLFKINRSEAEEIVHKRNQYINNLKVPDDSVAEKFYFIERCGSSSNSEYCSCKL